MSKRAEREAIRQRKQIRLELESKAQIRAFAEQLGVPISQIVDLFIVYGLEGIENESIDLQEYLEESRSPLYRFVINLQKFKDRNKGD
jgi:hypothetical protein